MRDTSRDVDDRRLAIVRGLDPGVRLRLALEASELARRLALTRLRQVHPGLTERELVARWLHETFPTLELPAPQR
jgi:hypothetical protein